MKRVSLILLLLASFSTLAVPMSVGGVSVEIPTPASFARVIPAMTGVVGYQSHSIYPGNLRVASYIPQGEAPLAMEGGVPEMVRRYEVQTAKSIASRTVTPSDFAKLKGIYRTQGEQKMEIVKERLPAMFVDASKKISRQLDADILIELGGLVTLPPLHETDRVIAGSTIMRRDIKVDGKPSSEVITGTTTLIYVKNKVLFLYVFGGRDDLEWTQARSKEWAQAILATNS